MKQLKSHSFDPKKCRVEWGEFDTLLKKRKRLSERRDVLPFFKERPNLSHLISHYLPDFTNVDLYAHEFPIYGDFVADLVVGDSAGGNFLLVEFEDGTSNSTFKETSRSTPIWAPRFEGAFSQVLDWLWKLDDMKNTKDFLYVFGSHDVKFHGLIILGKDQTLTKQEQSRLKWRLDRVIVNSSPVSCVSFDDLRDAQDTWLTKYYDA